MRVLIIYASIGGRAEAIAKRISAQMSEEAVPNDLYNVVEESADEITIDAYDAVMLGSPVHNGQYDPRIEWCIRHYKQFLSEVPTAFFSVRDFAKHNGGDKELPLTADMETRFDWQPSMKQTFSCALRCSPFGLFISRLMHWLTEIPSEEAEATCNDEPNFCGAVNEFASQFTRFVRSCKQPPETRPQFSAWSKSKREYSVLPKRC